MATATLPNTNTGNQASPATTGGKTSTERFDIAYGFQLTDEKDKNGNPIKDAVVLTPEAAEKLEKENKFEGEVITVSVDYPASFDGLVELSNKPAVDDDGNPREQKDVKAEIVKLFVNGAKSKVMNRLRAQLTKVDDKGNLTFKSDTDAPDGVLDLTNEITSGSRRVFLTEEQKMWKGLSILPQGQKENVWRAYLTGINKPFYLPVE